MSEQLPNLSPEVVDLAWVNVEAADAADSVAKDAFRNLKKASQLAALAVPGITVTREAFETLASAGAQAIVDRDVYAAMAAPVMLMENSPFDISDTKEESLRPFNLALEEHLPLFLDPESEIAPSFQLIVMKEFWKTLGCSVPELTLEQKTKLEKELAEHPDRRVIPTPLTDSAKTDRKNIAEDAKAQFGKNKFHETEDPLWTPDNSWTYGKLLSDPETDVKDGNTTYGLRYKAVGGGLVKRSEYLASLKESGQAVEAEDGTIWTFPVMDVQIQSPRNYTTTRNLHSEVSPTATPESLIAMQLLHQAIGTPNPEWSVDFANEAVYELKKDGSVKELVSVASVRWGPNDRQVNLDLWNADDRNGDFGVRAEESGIKA